MWFLEEFWRAICFDTSIIEDSLSWGFKGAVKRLLLVSLVVSLFLSVGVVIGFWVGPSYNDVKSVLGGVVDDLVDSIRDPEVRSKVSRLLDFVWRCVALLLPSKKLLLFCLSLPVYCFVYWVVYSVLTHVFCVLLGGSGSLNFVFSGLTVSFYPLLFRVVEVFPFVSVRWGSSVWGLALAYFVVKRVYGLSVVKAVVSVLFAAFLTFVILNFAWLYLFLGVVG